MGLTGLMLSLTHRYNKFTAGRQYKPPRNEVNMKTKNYTCIGAAMIEVAMLAKDGRYINIKRLNGNWSVTSKLG